MDESEETTDEFPTELHERLTSFNDSLNNVEKVLQPLHCVSLNQLHEKLGALDKAKLDLLGVYAINSLFWAYLITKGEDPKQHGIKRELERIKSYMGRIKEIEDKAKAPKIDQGAAKRFIKSALWQQAQKKSAEADAKAASQSSEASTSQTHTVHKHFDDDDDDEPKAKKQKSHKKKKK